MMGRSHDSKNIFMDDLNGATKLNKIQLACVPFLSYGHSMAFMIDIGSFRHILWSYYIQVITSNTCPEYGTIGSAYFGQSFIVIPLDLFSISFSG